MTTYQIELATRTSARLIKDTNPKAAQPFDGGSIYQAPESYPCVIQDADTGASVEITDAAGFADLYATVIRVGHLPA